MSLKQWHNSLCHCYVFMWQPVLWWWLNKYDANRVTSQWAKWGVAAALPAAKKLSRERRIIFFKTKKKKKGESQRSRKAREDCDSRCLSLLLHLSTSTPRPSQSPMLSHRNVSPPEEGLHLTSQVFQSDCLLGTISYIHTVCNPGSSIWRIHKVNLSWLILVRANWIMFALPQ